MKKVLIAEDEQVLLKALVTKITKLGYGVISASNGIEASELALKEKPDLLLLDIMMPGKHGIDVFNEIRESEWGKKVPIVFLSNYSDHPEATKLSQKDGNCDYLVKSSTKLSKIIELVEDKLK